MTSLADELMADLDDDLAESREPDEADVDDLEMSDEEADVDEQEAAAFLSMDMLKVKSALDIAKLWKSSELQEALHEINTYRMNPRNEGVQGPIEEDPEYKLIVKCNHLTVEIDTEIALIHKFVLDHYSKKFPELSNLISNALDYIQLAKAIGNEMDLMKVNLSDIVPAGNVMSITVAGATTSGRKLSEEDLQKVLEACDIALELNDSRKQILEYIEARMNFIAPNLSAIVGSSVASKLMGQAGGLIALSKMPSCNVQVLGAIRKNLQGFSTIQVQPHAGFVAQCDIVTNTPKDLRQKASRLVAAKCTLAARVDSLHEHGDGSLGTDMREEITHKLDKLQEPPPPKKPRPLPVPGAGIKKRRGGRRVRKSKEGYVMTELRKQQNRVIFGVAEEETGFDTGKTKGLGVMGAQSGRVRAATLNERTKVPARKPSGYAGSSGATSGLASSIVFTPVQGLELINPDLVKAAKAKETSSKYFSQAVSFDKIKKQ